MSRALQSQNAFTLTLALVLLAVGLTNGTKGTNSIKAHGCLENSGGEITLKCPKQNEKISVKSVSYAHVPNCQESAPPEENSCTQVSPELSTLAQQECNGKYNCFQRIMSIAESEKQFEGPGRQGINVQMESCRIYKRLEYDVRMNAMIIEYECEGILDFGEGIKCYSCPGFCAKNSNGTLVDCAANGFPDPYCIKIVTSGGDVGRSCSIKSLSSATENGCIKNITREVCRCNTDGCNGSDITSISYAVLILPFIAAKLFS